MTLLPHSILIANKLNELNIYTYHVAAWYVFVTFFKLSSAYPQIVAFNFKFVVKQYVWFFFQLLLTISNVNFDLHFSQLL